MSGGTPVIVLNQNTKREQGRKVQLTNIQSAKTVADVIRTCLGPQAMLKMLMDPMGGIVMTNDGNAILREITVQHPAAKSMIEIARTQDEEVGDGTTSVIILAGEILAVSTAFLEQSIHPTIIITAYRQALEDMLEMASSRYSVDVDTNDTDKMHELIRTCLGTRVHTQWNQVACRIALDAVRTVHKERGSDGQAQEIDIKRYARIEKIPGGSIEDSCVLDGIMINKDVVHPQMRRRIANRALCCWTATSSTRKARARPMWKSARRRTSRACCSWRKSTSRPSARLCWPSSPTWSSPRRASATSPSTTWSRPACPCCAACAAPTSGEWPAPSGPPLLTGLTSSRRRTLALAVACLRCARSVMSTTRTWCSAATRRPAPSCCAAPARTS
ncbi:hypothetical protein BOX15_Mlig012959g3 [Macrostomum lignano]|uniref:T-complex protein 1 subunit gamma n=1 Tax=Macrostomum lignano TaxID=282301 RepID=A0A267FSC0_9PLAT|nr:hypothetical protein BOX15_Mlig012959g3 [Macrostomum lignano]